MIEIKITGNTLKEAIDQVYILFQSEMAAQTSNTLLPPAIDRNAPTAPPVVVEDAPEEAPPTNSAPVEPPAIDSVAPPTEKKLTPEAVRAAGVAAAKKHGKEAVKAILDELGAEGLTALTQEQRPLFMEKVGELDAR